MSNGINVDKLESILETINGRGYKAYKVLKRIIIDYGIARGYFTRIQGDPYASPSWFEVVIPRSIHGFPSKWLHGLESTALTDYVARKLYGLLKKYSRKCGTGNSCFLGIPKPSPRILKRSCVEVDDNGSLILRFFIGLPSRGRKILGDKASDLLIDRVQAVIKSIVLLKNNIDKVRDHVTLFIDQEYLRNWLTKNNLVAFIADGSILPRESSLSEKPLENAVRFRSPPSLRRTVVLPSGKTISGMAVPEGIFLVTGGGYHGKTTLLEAIQDGVYNHVKGDGREFVVARKNTITVKAEDGRIVHCIDISSFFEKLPGKNSTRCYSSLDASGSASMASAINEAIEAGCEVLLVDEDTSATNLLFKDDVMAKIIEKEPIKPLSLQARSLFKNSGCSLIVVASASSAFMPIADKIIMMEEFKPRDITIEVRSLVKKHVVELDYKAPKTRVFKGINGVRRVKARGFKIRLTYVDGTCFELDLSNNPRIVESGQVRFIARIIEHIARKPVVSTSREFVGNLDKVLEEKGFKAYVNPVPPDLTMVSGLDVYWVLNRIPRAVFRQE